MPRNSDIENAFRNAIKQEPSGRRTVSTVDFVSELEALNWHMTMREANRWIEVHTTTFRDVSTEEGERRIFQVYNPNGGL
ncbi:DNA polymerase V [Salmonella enterica]|uniref:DNA polymerase V n=1 Tax=Salmonella enterica TaxID=28901 RepID=UPI0012EFD52C|nr:DNA polymerase V [Salmonella enterica]ECR4399137.1 DNA polymerase V [Salmonella enterica subsp. enterica serovar Ona]EED9365774.1 DNA polymerase V [Salmonella enterica subsp. enterica serovar Ituri]